MEARGSLYLVSTPIGNLDDMSRRAIETLRAVTLILAEDTRHSRPLLDHYEIRTRVAAFHAHNEAEMTARVLERLRAGDDVAMISDAGTPLLSDPGARLVGAAIDDAVRVVPVPGASALLSALIPSGLSVEAFTFLGFLPRRGADRHRLIELLSNLPHTAVLYEAPARVGDTLAELAEHGLASRKAVVARELTKRFEEFRRGTVEELSQYYLSTPPRGEVVILIDAHVPRELDERQLEGVARSLREMGYSSRDVAARLRDEHGAPRNVAYRIAHES